MASSSALHPLLRCPSCSICLVGVSIVPEPAGQRQFSPVQTRRLPDHEFRDLACTDRFEDHRHALSDRSHPQPRVINTDLAPTYGAAIADIKKEGTLRSRCRHRPLQYLNNIIEQDHRAIKRRVKAKQGFREFQAARRTIQGYEAMSIIRKGQVRWLSGNDVRRQNRFINELFEVAA